MGGTFKEPTDRTNLGSVWLAFLLFAALLIAAVSPAFAHTDHKKKQEAAAQLARLPSQVGLPAATIAVPNDAHAQMGEMMEGRTVDRSTMSTFERVVDWLGRLHPMIVHFPMAFFPTALFTAHVGHRRPSFAKPVQFLIVSGGILAPIAALVGWFNGGFDVATDDAMLQPHRWLGTAIGIGAFGLGAWAWRRPEDDRSFGMIVGLTVITAAIVVQGWFGGALVHGFDHMNW